MGPNSWRQASLQFAPILILTAQRMMATNIGEMLRGFGPHGSISVASSNDEALAMTAAINPKLLFVDQVGANIDGLRFVRDLRRSQLAAVAAPVIMISEERTISALREAQNSGVHEYLVKPLSAAHLIKRLDAVVAEWRPWFETQSYAGPDRRRFNAGADAARKNRRKVLTPPQ